MKFKKAVKYESGRIYPAVSITGLSREMAELLPIIDAAFIHQGLEAVMSAGTEPFYEMDGDSIYNYLIHSIGSLHPAMPEGNAVDISCRGISVETAIVIQNEIQSKADALRKGYQIIYHGKYKHLHCQWRRVVE